MKDEGLKSNLIGAEKKEVGWKEHSGQVVDSVEGCLKVFGGKVAMVKYSDGRIVTLLEYLNWRKMGSNDKG